MPPPTEQWRENFHKELQTKDPGRYAAWKQGSDTDPSVLDRDLVLVSAMKFL